jgi:hypothetical protein
MAHGTTSLDVYPTCQPRTSSFDFDMVTSSSPSSLQGSTIVVQPYIDPQPTRCCTRCRNDFPATSAYFKAFKKGGLAAMCVDCTAKNAAAKRAKEQCTQQAVSGETRGRKRRVLEDMDPNVQRKAPRLAPNEPTRWDMASQNTKEQMRLKAARDRENRYRRNNCITLVPTHSPGMDLLAFSSIPLPSRTPPPPPPPSHAPREAPISDTDWTNINTFHEYLSRQEMETCARCKERWFQMGLLNGVCGA